MSLAHDSFDAPVESLLSTNVHRKAAKPFMPAQFHCNVLYCRKPTDVVAVACVSPLLYLQNVSSDLLPPVQAAFLDLKLAGVLGELLGRLVPVLGQGADAGSLCTMVLEAILTLQDPETCLNPMASALQRVPDETPAPNEASCSALMISFGVLWVN